MLPGGWRLLCPQWPLRERRTGVPVAGGAGIPHPWPGPWLSRDEISKERGQSRQEEPCRELPSPWATATQRLGPCTTHRGGAGWEVAPEAAVASSGREVEEAEPTASAPGVASGACRKGRSGLCPVAGRSPLGVGMAHLTKCLCFKPGARPLQSAGGQGQPGRQSPLSCDQGPGPPGPGVLTWPAVLGACCHPALLEVSVERGRLGAAPGPAGASCPALI